MIFPQMEPHWKKRKKMPKNLTMIGSTGFPTISPYLAAAYVNRGEKHNESSMLYFPGR